MSFMVWNSFLAFIPLVLSVWLFRGRGARTIVWWLGLGIFIAFLPNAPYVLTDLIHLVQNIRMGYSIWVITLVLVPQYLLFMLAGFQAYVIAVINLGHYLQRQGYQKWVLGTELFIHFLCAIGIYLGRFPRFNSWDIVARPGTLITGVEQLLHRRPIVIIAITFSIMTLLYWVCKQINLALLIYWQQRHRQTLSLNQFSK
jgi:uncharacterized membrane protein